MKNIYIIAGEEFILKEDKIKEIRRERQDWNYKKIIVEDSKKEIPSSILQDAFMYLSTIDMFNLNNKILNIVVENARYAVEILKELIDCINENILIIDIRNCDLRALTSNQIYKANKSKIELEKYSKLEEKTRVNTIVDIKNMFKENNIMFVSKEEEDICAHYMYDNSDYSYTSIRRQIEQLKYFSEEELRREDIYEFMSESFNGNYYVLISKIFASNNRIELIKHLESTFSLFDKSEYISFLNIFIYTLKEYLRFEKGIKCKNGLNFYQFKNSKLKIVRIEKLISSVSKLNFSSKNSSVNTKEEFLLLIWIHFENK